MGFSCSSQNETHVRLSTVSRNPQGLEKVERDAQRLGISVAQLCATAGVAHTTWHRARRSGNMRASTFRKLKAALVQIKRQKELSERTGDLISSVYQMFVGLLAQAKGLSPLDVVQADPHANLKGDEAWLIAATVRHQAIYLTVTTLDVPGSAAAVAANISKQAVSKALRSVEDSRDDPAIDRMLDEFEGLVRGQGVSV